MNNVLVRVKKSNKFELTKILFDNSIFYNYVKEDNKYLLIKMSFDNYKKTKKVLNVKLVKFYGKKEIIRFLKKNYLFLLSFLWGIILLFSLSNMIFSVEIETNNMKLKEQLYNELESFDIKKYGKIKSYNEIENIKKQIIKKNSDKIEWLEIKRYGTKYTVLLTERIIIKKNNIDSTHRHIVASKDALIKHIVASNGDVVKEVNDYVKKGEIIISGNIFKNDKLVSTVRAEGKAYGEVWYIVKTKVPFKYIEYVRTGKIVNHYYIEMFGKKMTILGKYDVKNSMSTKKVIINKPYLYFKLIKEKKELYEYKEYNISKDEAIKEAVLRSDKSIKNKLNKSEYVTNKKVLNISPSSSKIEIEVFYKVYEDITDILMIEEMEKE